MTTRSVIEMKAHAHAIASAFHVHLIELDHPLMRHEDAMALPGFGLVVVTPIIDETTYAVALHEIGHLASPAGSVRTRDTRDSLGLTVFEEEAAWDWARHYALEWTPVMEQHVVAWAMDGPKGYRTALKESQRRSTPPQKKPINWNDWK